MKNFKLDNEPKIKTGFKIPEHYFDSFSDKITSELNKEEPKEISLWDRNKRWFYKIAAILVLSLSIPIANQFRDVKTNENTEIENYLAYNSTLLDDDIIELLEKEDIAKIEVETTIDDKTIEEALFNNAEIENYITN
ncbi:hypothetical protein [Flavobacterium sp.]|uniref:hypothetical protein n=1 Tax=Flavobacterium sp. TaxID=239 RepID=UPI003751E5B1